MRQALVHRVLPMVLSKTRAQWPEHDRPRWTSFLQQMWGRHAAQLRVLEAVADALRQGGLSFLVFKGVPLAATLYGDPVWRPAADVDLLVRPDDVDAASRIMTALGFTTEWSAWYRRHHFHLIWKREDASLPSAVVELHWDLTAPTCGVRFPLDSWWRNARPMRVGNLELPVPALANWPAYLAWHALLGGTTNLAALAEIRHAMSLLERDGAAALAF
ncbi:MAG: nucleotidyltransferase family protein, partial [Acidobacteria bacterium]|nr:nucleotidyltransferase family protein [Acidobacteriota bacterium]